MDQARAVFLIGPDPDRRSSLEETLGEIEVRSFAGLGEAEAGLDDEPVILLVTAGVPDSEVLALARRISDEDREWIVLQEEEGEGGEPAFRPVSVGYAVGPARVAAAAAGTDAERPLFDLLEVLRGVARVRHDINNPLTAGLAETQLLLMDVEGQGEVRESLETVQRQLRRIQELVEDLADFRRPSRRVG